MSERREKVELISWLFFVAGFIILAGAVWLSKPLTVFLTFAIMLVVFGYFIRDALLEELGE